MVDLYLNTNQLAKIRAQLLEFLPDTAVVRRATVSKDDYGVPVETWSNVGTYACRVDPFEKQEGQNAGEIGGREASKAWYFLSMPVTSTLNLSDQVTVNNVIFEVVRFFDASSKKGLNRYLIAFIQNDQGDS